MTWLTKLFSGFHQLLYGFFQLKKSVLAVYGILVLWTLYFLYLNVGKYASIEFIRHDAIYWILPALGPSMGLGLPYKDFWDEKSPGLFYLIKFWSLIFGPSNFSFKLMHLATLLGGVVLFWFILKKIVSKKTAVFTYLAAVVFYFSLFLDNNFLSVEQLGTIVALSGFLFLMLAIERRTWLPTFFAAFLLFFAGFVKDPFFLCAPALLPLFLMSIHRKQWKLFWRDLFLVAAAFACVILMMVGYVLFYGVLNYFLEIQTFKNTKFSPFKKMADPVWFYHFAVTYFDRVFLWGTFLFRSILLFLSISVAGSFLFKYVKNIPWRQNKFYAVPEGIGQNDQQPSVYPYQFWSVVLFFIGAIFGTYLQGKLHSGHYLYLAILPLFLMLSLMFDWITALLGRCLPPPFRRWVFAASVILLLGLIVPKKEVLAEYSFRGENFLSVMHQFVKNPDIPNKYSYIREHTKPDDRILSLYGWSVGTTYYYSHRKGISRFLLLHPSMFTGPLLGRYVRDFIMQIPVVVVYQTEGADMDVGEFESLTFNMENILTDFYNRDRSFPDLFFLKVPREQVQSALLGPEKERYLGRNLLKLMNQAKSA